MVGGRIKSEMSEGGVLEEGEPCLFVKVIAWIGTDTYAEELAELIVLTKVPQGTDNRRFMAPGIGSESVIRECVLDLS